MRYLIQIAFIFWLWLVISKMMGMVDILWLWILSPLWMPVLFYVVVLVAVVVWYLIEKYL